MTDEYSQAEVSSADAFQDANMDSADAGFDHENSSGSYTQHDRDDHTQDDANIERKIDLLNLARDAVDATDMADPLRGTSSVPQGDFPDSPDAHAADAQDPPFHEHPRWQEMMAERDSYRGKAEQYDQISDFMDQNNLMTEEVVELLTVGALLKTDPTAAMERIRPYFEQLQSLSGEKLDGDLAQRVASGALDEATARELSQHRQLAALNVAQSTVRADAIQSAHTQHAQQQAGQAMMSAVAEWEQGIAAKDPDYATKQAFVRDRIRAIATSEGVARSPQGAVAVAKRAYAEISDQLRQAQPSRGSRRSVRGGQISGTPGPQPSSVLEAARMALGR